MHEEFFKIKVFPQFIYGNVIIYENIKSLDETNYVQSTQN